MKLYLTVFFLLLVSASLFGDESINSFDQALDLSQQNGKPILLEIGREDCLYCALAESDADSVTALKQALTDVIHYAVKIDQDEGRDLADRYRAGKYFPVFILMNKRGDVINRWTGYTTPDKFIASLKSALSSKMSINELEIKYRADSSVLDAVNLARYFTESGNHLKALRYYRDAAKTDSVRAGTYLYKIFRSSALASENGQLPFDSVLAVADRILSSNRIGDKINMVRILSNLARQKNRTNVLTRYLTAAIDLAKNSKNANFTKYLPIFGADLALYHQHDTAQATEIYKNGLGNGWQNEPDKFFAYTGWCLERKINLEEAYTYCLKAANMVKSGKFKGYVLGRLAGICFELGRVEEAVKYVSQAIDEDPDNIYYPEHLERYLESIN